MGWSIPSLIAPLDSVGTLRGILNLANQLSRSLNRAELLDAFVGAEITRITGWRLHYCVPRVKGGSTGATNCVLLHPECHDRVHRQRLSISKPRLL
jgi:HNH endonuclease